MLVCRRGRTNAGHHRRVAAALSRPGGPVFVPRRRPSLLAETLIARSRALLAPAREPVEDRQGTRAGFESAGA